MEGSIMTAMFLVLLKSAVRIWDGEKKSVAPSGRTDIRPLLSKEAEVGRSLGEAFEAFEVQESLNAATLVTGRCF